MVSVQAFVSNRLTCNAHSPDKYRAWRKSIPRMSARQPERIIIPGTIAVVHTLSLGLTPCQSMCWDLCHSRNGALRATNSGGLKENAADSGTEVARDPPRGRDPASPRSGMEAVQQRPGDDARAEPALTICCPTVRHQSRRRSVGRRGLHGIHQPPSRQELLCNVWMNAWHPLLVGRPRGVALVPAVPLLPHPLPERLELRRPAVAARVVVS
mmetsp:Transcript_77748/g.227935  ORF Transcript_77748/g.227935 Transcript_77748/m.227935 type:complete len:212 (-) Transcript_77748:404-1039(-)